MAFPEAFLRAPDSPVTSLADLDFFYSVANSPMLHVDDGQDAEIRDLLQKIANEFSGQKQGYVSVLKSFFHIFIVNLQRMYADDLVLHSTEIEPDLVRRFKKLVAERFVLQASVQEYADELGVSVSRLNSVVKDGTGMTPGQIMRNELVLAAKRLLAHSNKNISEICFELNFEDPSYFGRFFKREAGVTPSVFREDVREKYHHFAR